jgi:hypothetical protein
MPSLLLSSLRLGLWFIAVCLSVMVNARLPRIFLSRMINLPCQTAHASAVFQTRTRWRSTSCKSSLAKLRHRWKTGKIQADAKHRRATSQSWPTRPRGSTTGAYAQTCEVRPQLNALPTLLLVDPDSSHGFQGGGRDESLPLPTSKCHKLQGLSCNSGERVIVSRSKPIVPMGWVQGARDETDATGRPRRPPRGRPLP